MTRQYFSRLPSASLPCALVALVLTLLVAAGVNPVAAAAGDLDTSFGSDGKVTTAIGSGSDRARSVAIQSDGKIVAAGFSYSGSEHDFALVRYNADGSLDTTFDSDGKVTTDLFNLDAAFSVAIQSDSKIVVAGESYNGSDYDFALVRYNADGSLDTTFGSDGKVTTDLWLISGIDIDDEHAFAVAIQSDGKIVVAGAAGFGNRDDIALVRYNTDGTLDTTFGTGNYGAVTTAIGSSGNDNAFSLAIQSNGKILVACDSFNSSDDDFALVRYNSDGTLDNTFGSDGKVTTAIGSDDEQAFAVAIQSDGKIVVAGNSFDSDNGSGYDFALVRYNTDGSLDTTFDSDGKVTTPIFNGFSFNGTDVAYSVAIQSDGKIMAAGFSYSGSKHDFALVRYNTDGSLDTTFGSDGKVTTAIGSGTDVARSVAIQADGKIVVAGYSHNGSNYDFALARYIAITPAAAP